MRLGKKSGEPWDWLFLAMTQKRLGRAAEAGRSLEKAREKIAAFEQDHVQPWDLRLEVRLLSREAEALLSSSPLPSGERGWR